MMVPHGFGIDTVGSPAANGPMEFKVATDVFSGPMDLLLYLVKKHEVDVTEVPARLRL